MCACSHAHAQAALEAQLNDRVGAVEEAYLELDQGLQQQQKQQQGKEESAKQVCCAAIEVEMLGSASF